MRAARWPSGRGRGGEADSRERRRSRADDGRGPGEGGQRGPARTVADRRPSRTASTLVEVRRCRTCQDRAAMRSTAVIGRGARASSTASSRASREQGDVLNAWARRTSLGDPRSMAMHEARAPRGQLGPDHPDTLRAATTSPQAYLAAGRTAEAIALYEATLKLRESKARPRPPRHARQPQQPRPGLPGRRPHRRGDRAARGDAQADRSRSSAPTTPTRSSAATTSPTPTRPPAARPRRSRCTRRRSS